MCSHILLKHITKVQIV